MTLNPTKLSEFEAKVRAAYELEAKIDQCVTTIDSLQRQLSTESQQHKFWKDRADVIWAEAYEIMREIQDDVKSEVYQSVQA